jgi:hypothetical protein
MSDPLEQRLKVLGAAISFPPTPDLVESWQSDLAPSAKPRHYPRLWLRAVAVALITTVVSVGLIPGARSAIADLLGLGGVGITIADIPEVAISSLPTGERSSVEVVGSTISFSLLFPTTLDDPDEIYLDNTVPGGLVTMVYGHGKTSYRMVITEFSGVFNEQIARKTISPQTLVQPVDVNANPGLWIHGSPHSLMLIDTNGHPREDTTRLVGNTLLFQSDSITVRIESRLDLAETLQIAQSLDPKP